MIPQDLVSHIGPRQLKGANKEYKISPLFTEILPVTPHEIYENISKQMIVNIIVVARHFYLL